MDSIIYRGATPQPAECVVVKMAGVSMVERPLPRIAFTHWMLLCSVAAKDV